jgi:hypothetical protein
MKNLSKFLFFFLISGGTVFTLLVWSSFPLNFPETAKLPIIWLTLSMGVFWAIDRILHALGGIAGETERDGVIWLIPISLGWMIPIIFFLTESILNKYCLFTSIFIYCFISYTILTFARPEIPKELTPCYCESKGLDSIRYFFCLLKYKMIVIDSSESTEKYNQLSGIRAPSFSYLFYALCFGFAALSVSMRIDQKYLLGFASLLFAGTFFIMNMTWKAKEDELLWRIQDKHKEGIFLCILFGLSTVNIIGFLFVAIII